MKVAVSIKKIGYLPSFWPQDRCYLEIGGCLALGCCGVGEAVLDTGETVTTTYGRDLTAEDAARYAEKTDYTPVSTPLTFQYYELIIPKKKADAIKSILIRI